MKKEYGTLKINVVTYERADVDCLVGSVEAIDPVADGYWGDGWEG